MKNLWLLIPVKELGRGKSRLAQTLTPVQRAALTRQILERTLKVAAATHCFAEILVVSTDRTAHNLAMHAGAQSLCEDGFGLNQALEEARAYALARGAEATLIVPADLPLLTNTDLTRLVRAAETGSQVVLAPSNDGGTNALLLSPPEIIDFHFGPNSFAHHRRAADTHNARIAVIQSPSLAFDVDWPADLQRLGVLHTPLTAGTTMGS
jgi:2-phospho-L-lactate guanylyltransferase